MRAFLVAVGEGLDRFGSVLGELLSEVEEGQPLHPESQKPALPTEEQHFRNGAIAVTVVLVLMFGAIVYALCQLEQLPS